MRATAEEDYTTPLLPKPVIELKRPQCRSPIIHD
jgi:hypothetical protein